MSLALASMAFGFRFLDVHSPATIIPHFCSLKPIMEQSIFSMIFENIAKQGFSFIILAGVVWYFHRELERVKADYERTNEEIKNLYKSHSEQMIQIIEKNTVAFERNNELFSEIKKELHG